MLKFALFHPSDRPKSTQIWAAFSCLEPPSPWPVQSQNMFLIASDDPAQKWASNTNADSSGMFSGLFNSAKTIGAPHHLSCSIHFCYPFGDQTWQWYRYYHILSIEVLNRTIIHKWRIFQHAMFYYQRVPWKSEAPAISTPVRPFGDHQESTLSATNRRRILHETGEWLMWPAQICAGHCQRYITRVDLG